MIRSDLALSSYRNSADLYHTTAAAASPLRVGGDSPSAASLASPSYKVSLSPKGQEMSLTALAKPIENPPFQEPDWKMFENQHKAQNQSEASTAAHVAQLDAEYRSINAARLEKNAAQSKAHDLQKKQELDAMVAEADAKAQAANRTPLPAPQVAPIAEGVKGLADTSAQNKTSSAVAPPPPPASGA